MKKIEKYIVIFIILIICLIIGIIIFNKFQDKKEYEKIRSEIDEVSSDEDKYIEKEYGNENYAFDAVSKYNDYFAVKNILLNYFSYIKYINGDIYINPENNQDKNVKSNIRNSGLEAISNMLDESYNNEKISEEAKKYVVKGDYSTKNIEYVIDIDKLYITNISDSEVLFLAKVNVNKISTSFIIKVDLMNMRYSIFLEDYITKNNYSEKIKKEDIKISTDEIKENSNNSFRCNAIVYENMAREYYSIYVNSVLKFSDRLYSNLEDEYKSKKFESKEEYKEYINNLSEVVGNLELTKYDAKQKDNGTTVYKLVDNYNNCLTVTVDDKDVLNYKIQLDDYTIDSEEYIQNYEKANDNQKVMTNIERFIKMINLKDYGAAYKLLNKSFKNNYFQTQKSFETYMKNKVIRYVKEQSIASMEKSGVYYSCNVRMKYDDILGANMNFIVMLGEETNFEISFTK